MAIPVVQPSIDGITARNNTLVNLIMAGQRIGRVQQFREDINNNVQVLAELGNAYMVQFNKGITSYSFTIARFYCRADVFDELKLGAPFGLSVRDDGIGAGAETLEYFPSCSIASLSRDYTVGQASVGENATVVVIGKGVTSPVLTQ